MLDTDGYKLSKNIDKLMDECAEKYKYRDDKDEFIRGYLKACAKINNAVWAMMKEQKEENDILEVINKLEDWFDWATEMPFGLADDLREAIGLLKEYQIMYKMLQIEKPLEEDKRLQHMTSWLKGQKKDNQELIQKLKEHAEYAEANEWELPITLGDDLKEAVEVLERGV